MPPKQHLRDNIEFQSCSPNKNECIQSISYISIYSNFISNSLDSQLQFFKIILMIYIQKFIIYFCFISYFNSNLTIITIIIHNSHSIHLQFQIHFTIHISNTNPSIQKSHFQIQIQQFKFKNQKIKIQFIHNSISIQIPNYFHFTIHIQFLFQFQSQFQFQFNRNFIFNYILYSILISNPNPNSI